MSSDNPQIAFWPGQFGDDYIARNADDGDQNVLFKCDFGSFWLDNVPDLVAAGYGFFWKRLTSLDNCNWWLFRKP
jgi:hypothetical protein